MEATTARRESWTFAQKGVVILAAAQLTWALVDTQPAWIFAFPHNASDAIFHLVTGALFGIVAAIQIAQDRRVNQLA
jgi:hypothetical protein